MTRPLQLALCVAAIALVAACSSSTGPAPASTPIAPAPSPASTTALSPTIAPTPTTPPVSAADVLASVTAADFGRSFAVTGAVTAGAQTFATSGVYEFKTGTGSHSMITHSAQDAAQTIERVTAAGTPYVKLDPEGPWLVDEAGNTDLAEVLARIDGLEDEGTGEFLGNELRRFSVPAGTLTPADFDLGAEANGFDGSVDLFVDDAGALIGARVAASWTAPDASGAPVPFAFEANYAATDDAPVIEAPALALRTYESKRQRYSVGYVDGWETAAGASATEPDAFFGAGEYMGVLLERQPKGVGLAGYIKAYLRGTEPAWGEPETSEERVIGGEPGRLLSYHPTIEGQPRFVVVGLAMQGLDGYQVFLVVEPGYEDEVKAVFEDILDTFQFVG